MKLIPKNDRVLLKETEYEINSEILLINDKSKTKIYEILDKGENCSDKITVGDKVICTSFIDGETIVEDQTYYLTKEINILAIIKN